MPFFDFLRRQDTAIEEASRNPTVQPPTKANTSRAGYTQGVPLGGATETNPASTSTGLIDRSDYLDQLLQAYMACPHASAAIDVIARTITAGGIEPVPNSQDIDRDQNQTIPESPPEVEKIKALLAYVNPDEDIRQLMRNVITDLLIFGDSFVEVVWLLGEPVAMYTLDPQTMTIQSDPHGRVLGYHQKMQTGAEADFSPHEVIHVKFDQPGSGLYGVSPTNKNILPITTWLFASALIKETMKRGDPLRAWVDWPIAMSEAEMKRFQQQYQIRNLGAQNIGNLLETKGGALVKELSINQLSNWMNVKQQSRDEIYTGYGVPPSKVGVIEAGNIGSGSGTSQDRMFNVNTCGPISELVLEKFTYTLLQMAYGVTDWHLAFGQVDWRDDQVLEDIADLRIRNGRWTVNKARAVIGEPPIDGGDDAFIIDRQALVLYSDLEDYSKAAVDAIKTKSIPNVNDAETTTGQAIHDKAATPDPAIAVPAKGPTIEDAPMFYSRSLWGPDQEATALEAAFRKNYQDKRSALLENLEV